MKFKFTLYLEFTTSPVEVGVELGNMTKADTEREKKRQN